MHSVDRLIKEQREEENRALERARAFVRAETLEVDEAYWRARRTLNKNADDICEELLRNWRPRNRTNDRLRIMFRVLSLCCMAAVVCGVVFGMWIPIVLGVSFSSVTLLNLYDLTRIDKR